MNDRDRDAAGDWMRDHMPREDDFSLEDNEERGCEPGREDKDAIAASRAAAQEAVKKLTGAPGGRWTEPLWFPRPNGTRLRTWETPWQTLGGAP